MSDTVRVRAIQPVIYKDKLYEPGADWEADRDVVQGLLDMDGQLEEVKEPSLLVVPSVGLYLPSEQQEQPIDLTKPIKKANN